MPIHHIIPDPETVLALEPEELAGAVIQYLNSLPPNDTNLHRYNFCLIRRDWGYAQEYQERISQALMEAWVWLEREGLIAPRPGTSGGDAVFVTRRGSRIKNSADLAVYRHANLLPKQLLHPVIAQKIWATFLRGDYDTAVFQAFKEVEVNVRDAGGYGPMDLGRDLMRKAFNINNGPLTDPNLVEAERQGLSDLFAGAIASYKNPHSHRNVPLGAEEAVEMIIVVVPQTWTLNRGKMPCPDKETTDAETS